MNDDQLIKSIQKAVKDEVRPLKEQVEIVKSKVDKLDLFQSLDTNQIRAIKEQQSVINEKLDAFEEVKVDLGEVKENLENVQADLKDLKELKETVDRIYPSVMQIELNIKAYGDMYKLNNDNAKKLDHRLKVVEEKSDIKLDPEFFLAEVS